jgi:hypothetical protein
MVKLHAFLILALDEGETPVSTGQNSRQVHSQEHKYPASEESKLKYATYNQLQPVTSQTDL